MPKLTPTDIPQFATTQLTLLDAELHAELQETNILLSSHTPTTLSRSGLAILNLQISSLRTGLGGKIVLELSLDPAVVPKGENADIPEHGIRTGDIVGVQEQPAGSAKKKDKSEAVKRGIEGVILRVGREKVEIVLIKEDVDIPSGGKLWMCVYLCGHMFSRVMGERWLICILVSSLPMISLIRGMEVFVLLASRRVEL